MARAGRHPPGRDRRRAEVLGVAVPVGIGLVEVPGMALPVGSARSTVLLSVGPGRSASAWSRPVSIGQVVPVQHGTRLHRRHGSTRTADHYRRRANQRRLEFERLHRSGRKGLYLRWRNFVGDDSGCTPPALGRSRPARITSLYAISWPLRPMQRATLARQQQLGMRERSATTSFNSRPRALSPLRPRYLETAGIIRWRLRRLPVSSMRTLRMLTIS